MNRFAALLFILWPIISAPCALGAMHRGPLPTAGGGGIPGTAFVTVSSTGTDGNNFTGGLGFFMTVDIGSNVTVNALGRWVVSGNSGTHTVRIRDAGGTDLGNVSVDTSGATPGQFKYVALGSPVVLTAGSNYYILSDETNAGDHWYSNDSSLSTTAVAVISASAYYDGTVHTNGSANNSFIPVSFKYTAP